MRWFALQVKSRHEAIAAAILENKGYDKFLPLCRSRRLWSDRIVHLDLPLFPGYVFCRFDPGDRSVPILTTPGVVRIVGIGGHAVPVDDAEIAAIQSIIKSGLAAEPWPYLQLGNIVRIQYGALSGLEGLLVEKKKRHRLVVSITILQRSVAVEIDSAWVTPVRTTRRSGVPALLASSPATP
ncbi:MAG: transcription termination/antitermination NusG family protein [Bryobacteraceae bacterium]